jgi:hypothetical protein
MPFIEGKKVRLRGAREMVVPPLDVRTIRRFTKNGKMDKVMEIASLGGLPTDEHWGALVELLHAAMQVNYPEITEEEVEGLVDFSNLSEVLDALFFASGFRRIAKGEADSPSTGTT